MPQPETGHVATLGILSRPHITMLAMLHRARGPFFCAGVAWSSPGEKRGPILQPWPECQGPKLLTSELQWASALDVSVFARETTKG